MRISVAEDVPVTREGRFVYASSEELTAWVGTERGQKEPVHIASEGEDLLGDLKEGTFICPPPAEDSEFLSQTVK